MAIRYSLMMAEEPFYTLIGDVVQSRRSPDRAALQERLREALTTMNEALSPRAPLEATTGDEFQGCFRTASEATKASLLIRLDLLRGAGVDTRYGLGFGPVEVFARRHPISQDGPGWWSAREAIEICRRLAGASQTRYVRTYFKKEEADIAGRGEETMLNAFLLCRDAMVDRMKQATRNRLYGLMVGRSQAEIAEEEGATQGAISQSLTRGNAFALLEAQRVLEERSE